jgi:RING-type zinc-finger
MTPSPPAAAAASGSSSWALAAASLDDETVWTCAPFDDNDGFQRQLRDWERSLRCAICGEFLAAPVSLQTCGHTFCSECIRWRIKTEIQSQTRKATCPVCRTSLGSGDAHRALVPNRALEAVIGPYQALRDELKQRLMRAAAATTTGSRESVSRVVESNESVPRTRTVPAVPAPTEPPRAKKRSFSYHGMKKSKLQEWCRAEGLSTTGTEVELRLRHESYCVLYNAECDAARPRPISVLLEVISAREREKAAAAKGSNVSQQAMARGFQALMAQARQRREQQRNVPTTAPMNQSPEEETDNDMATTTTTTVPNQGSQEARSEDNELPGQDDNDQTVKTKTTLNQALQESRPENDDANALQASMSLPGAPLEDNPYRRSKRHRSDSKSNAATLKPWSCHKCTFYHAMPKQGDDLPHCQMCGSRAQVVDLSQE